MLQAHIQDDISVDKQKMCMVLYYEMQSKQYISSVPHTWLQVNGQHPISRSSPVPVPGNTSLQKVSRLSMQQLDVIDFKHAGVTCQNWKWPNMLHPVFTYNAYLSRYRSESKKEVCRIRSLCPCFVYYHVSFSRIISTPFMKSSSLKAMRSSFLPN